MGLVGRRILAALVACVMAGATPALAAPAKPKPAPAQPRAIESTIAMAVNGEELPLEPAPRIVGKGGGRLLVPVVRIYSALGIAVSRSGDAITASAPGKEIVLHIGSTDATIDGSPVTMEAPAMTIDGTTYVPLR